MLRLPSLLKQLFKSSLLTLAIVFRLWSSDLAWSAAESTACGPNSFANLAVGLERIAQQSARSYASNARSEIRQMLRLATEDYNRGLLPSKAIRYGVVQILPDSILPSNPRQAAMVQRAMILIQSEDVILDFVEETARRSALHRLTASAAPLDPTHPMKLVAGDISLLQTLANEAGWGEITRVSKLYQPEQFRTTVLLPGKLFYDETGPRIQHTASAHVLQWLMLTPRLEKEFGAGSAQELWRIMSTPEGQRYWTLILDQGFGYTRDLRGPQAWGVTGIVGPNSWLGVD